MKIAVIDDNTLTGIGLQHLLQDMLQNVEIEMLTGSGGIRDMEDGGENAFAHYFVASRIFFEHAAFFRRHPDRTIVLVNGEMGISGIRTLNVCQSEEGVVRDIMRLHSHGHGGQGKGTPHEMRRQTALLSRRETEVAALLCKGMINKEVAEALNISIATVMTHRKTIMEKLNARSIADVMVYAVMNGIVRI